MLFGWPKKTNRLGPLETAEEHARDLLSFVGAWDRKQAIVVHCYAGISRSTAAAFITMCALRPELAEADIARSLRAASPFATPNVLLVGFADRILGREGRMGLRDHINRSRRDGL